MLRRSTNSRPSKPEPKRQKSQQPKTLKIGRKNQNLSPVYKQIMINKQNIHPNRNNTYAINHQNECDGRYDHRMSPTSFANVNIGHYKFNNFVGGGNYNNDNIYNNSTTTNANRFNKHNSSANINTSNGAHLDETKFRDKYFQIKQSKYNRIQKNKPLIVSPSPATYYQNSINNFNSQYNQDAKINNVFSNICNHDQNASIATQPRNPQSLYTFLRQKTPKPECIHTQDLKITNRSLQKCQIHPQQIVNCSSSISSPKAEFIIIQQKMDKQGDKDKQESLKGDILCCQECAIKFIANGAYSSDGCKSIVPVPMDRITNTQIGGGLTISQYFKILNDKYIHLQKIKKNLQICDKQYRQMAAKQLQRHLKYYNDILQIIQVSMKQSEAKINRNLSEGERIIRQKKQMVDNQLRFTKQQRKRLLDFQQKQYKYNLSPLNNKIDLNFQKVFKQNWSEMELNLPIVQLFIQIPDIKQNFTKNFQQNFSLKVLTQVQLDQKAEQKQKTKKVQIQTQSQQSVYEKTSCRHAQQPDLFCDEEILESKSNRTHQFSFQKSNEQEAAIPINNQCIVQLVEQQDVISPVFKVI